VVRVLLIEDNPLARASVEHALKSVGYEVSTANDGRQGVALFRKMRQDLVITDILMPGQEGVETILELRRMEPGLPVLAISGGWGNDGPDLLKMVSRLGATETLQKPFDKQALLTAVRKCLPEDSASRDE
jgi:DNA-binding response OmpR family regulator